MRSHNKGSPAVEENPVRFGWSLVPLITCVYVVGSARSGGLLFLRCFLLLAVYLFALNRARPQSWTWVLAGAGVSVPFVVGVIRTEIFERRAQEAAEKMRHELGAFQARHQRLPEKLVELHVPPPYVYPACPFFTYSKIEPDAWSLDFGCEQLTSWNSTYMCRQSLTSSPECRWLPGGEVSD